MLATQSCARSAAFRYIPLIDSDNPNAGNAGPRSSKLFTSMAPQIFCTISLSSSSSSSPRDSINYITIPIYITVMKHEFAFRPATPHVWIETVLSQCAFRGCEVIVLLKSLNMVFYTMCMNNNKKKRVVHNKNLVNVCFLCHLIGLNLCTL